MWIAIGAVAAILVLAVLKPWERGPASARPSSVSESTSVAATAMPEPPSSPVSRALCFNPRDWRLVTVEQTEDREIRTWIAVRPIGATGPSDPRLEPVRIVAHRLVGLGFCAPDEVPQAVTRIDAHVWGLRGGDPVALPFAMLEPLPDYDSGIGKGQVYSPPDGLRNATRGWSPGRYAIELRGLRRGERSLWFAFRIVAATPPRPTAAP